MNAGPPALPVHQPRPAAHRNPKWLNQLSLSTVNETTVTAQTNWLKIHGYFQKTVT